MSRLALLVLATAVACLIVGADASARTPSIGGFNEEAEQILIRFREGASPTDVDRLASLPDATYNPTLNVWRADLPPGVTAEAALQDIGDDPNVELAQPNYVYRSARSPDDPEYDRVQRGYFAAINAEAGWDLETGGADIVVAVLDGGVDIAHQELDSKIWANTSELPNGMDDDGNGCIDDVHGCSFLTDIPVGEISDLNGHGTFVSGIIAAESDNGDGVAGLAWGATIMPVRVLDTEGFGTTEQLAAGILYGARNGAAVENLSLSLTPLAGTCPDDPVVDDALMEAHDEHGVVIAAAAGNAGIGCVSFPAASEYTVAVAGSSGPSDPDSRAFFSQWGPEVDLAAPAIDIYSTLPGDSFGSNLGTSFATPFVAGLSALLLSQDSSRTNETVRQIMRETARDVPSDGFANWDGAGIIDVGAALGASPVFAILDVSASQISQLDLSLRVEVDGSPDCEATLWRVSSIAGATIRGSFGAGQCGEFWPPSPARPWSLIAAYSGTKSAVLNAFALTNGDIACAVGGLPTVISPGIGSASSIDCVAEGQVVNDAPQNAQYVAIDSLPSVLHQDVKYATAESDPSVSCAAEFSRSVWFRLGSVGAPADIVIDTVGSDFDTLIAIFAGDPDDAEEVACNDDFDSPQSRVVLRTDGASDYHLLVAAYQHVPAGRLRLNVSRAFSPPNDTIVGSRIVALGEPYPVVQPAHSATAATSDPVLSCVPSYGFSLWFQTNTSDAATLVASTHGSTYDTVVGVLEDIGGDVVEISCNDDSDLGDRTSRASWEALSGRQYYVVVGAFAKRSGGALRLYITDE
jgi:subtilisin family serine protease